MYSCEKGLKVKPQQGTVIFWYSLHPNGNTDPNGLHAACPVEEGQKWSANYWVWNKPRYPRNPGTVFGEQEAAAKGRSTAKKSAAKEDGGALEESPGGGFGLSVRACAGLAFVAVIGVIISVSRRVNGGSQTRT